MNNVNLGWRIAQLALFATLCGPASSMAQEVANEEETVQKSQELSDQAAKLASESKFAAAVPLVEQALAIRERLRGPDHPDTAAALNQLGQLFRAMGAYDKAEPLHQRAL